MPVLLCSHTDCRFSQEVEIPYFTNGSHITWYCVEHRGPTEFLPRPGFKDCQFCKDEITNKDVFRHNGGKLYHVDCLIRLLLDEIHDLKNPLTGEVQDDSIPRAFKKLRSAAREYSRIINRTTREKANPNHYYGTLKNPSQGMYKGHICVTWKKALDIARRAVLAAITELEKLT